MLLLFALNCLPVSTVCPQLSACLNYCLPVSTVCLSHLPLPLQVDEDDFERAAFHYKARAEEEAKAGASSHVRVQRISQEVVSMEGALPCCLSSTVFLRVDSTAVDMMKAVITGPLDTPYSGGVFLFDIFCPR